MKIAHDFPVFVAVIDDEKLASGLAYLFRHVRILPMDGRPFQEDRVEL